MKTTTVRDLRHDFGKVEAWVNQGVDVLITKRGKPVMLISLPEGPAHKRPSVDFRKIRKEVSEGRVLSKKDVKHMWAALRDEHEA